MTQVQNISSIKKLNFVYSDEQIKILKAHKGTSLLYSLLLFQKILTWELFSLTFRTHKAKILKVYRETQIPKKPNNIKTLKPRKNNSICINIKDDQRERNTVLC
jgi:hypothetical protein